MWILLFSLVALTVLLVADGVAVDRRSLALPGALAALALWAALSAVWSPAVAWPVLEAERIVLYAMASAALVLVVNRERAAPLLAGIVGGATLVALYALATRLFPGKVGGVYDPSAGYQLAEPIGYSNALGMTFALGAVLASGLALTGGSRGRLVAGATLVPIGVALYFTFSRGAVLALLVGALVLLVVDRRAVVGLPVLALAPAAGIVLASRSAALTSAGYPLGMAQEQGARLAWQLGVLVVAAAAVSWAIPRALGRVPAPRLPARRLVWSSLGVLAVVSAVALVRVGGPAAAVDEAVAAFDRESPAMSGSLGSRLVSLSGHGRADYWRVASGMVADEPLLGEGAGSFERHWLAERPVPHSARDAHNLYLETLAELGPLGLALLLVALGAPLAARRVRPRGELAPAALAAYAAFLAHAVVDWDWELPLVVLPALACAGVLLADARVVSPIDLTARRRALLVGVTVVVLGIGLVAHVGNGAAAEAAAALERGDADAAVAAARRARAWQPWSHEPWQLLGEAQLAARDDDAARTSLREALRRAPEEWRLWFDLAIVSKEAERRRAVTRARELNPHSPEILDLAGR